MSGAGASNREAAGRRVDRRVLCPSDCNRVTLRTIRISDCALSRSYSEIEVTEKRTAHRSAVRRRDASIQAGDHDLSARICRLAKSDCNNAES